MHRRLLAALLISVFAVATLNYWLPVFIFRWVGFPAAFSRLIFALLLIALAVIRPGLRRHFPISFKRSWILLVACLPVFGNASYLFSSPLGFFAVSDLLAILINALAIGVLEEFFFRGLPFARKNLASRRLTVVLSAVAFSAVHLAGLATATPPPFIAASILAAIPIGVLFGIIRLATGGVVWPALCHGAVDFTGAVAYKQALPPELTIIPWVAFVAMIVVTAIAFFQHPAMSGPEEA